MDILLQVSNKVVQTDTSFLLKGRDAPLFNLKFNEDTVLSTCDSFIVENTLADDDTPVYVDRDVQTLESGGLVSSVTVQTEHLSVITDFAVFIENCISESINQDEDLLGNLRPKTDSWCQTLILGLQ